MMIIRGVLILMRWIIFPDLLTYSRQSPRSCLSCALQRRLESARRYRGEGTCKHTCTRVKIFGKSTRLFIDVYISYDPPHTTLSPSRLARTALHCAPTRLANHHPFLLASKQTSAASQHQRARPTGRWREQLGHPQRQVQSRQAQLQHPQRQEQNQQEPQWRELQKRCRWKEQRRPLRRC